MLRSVVLAVTSLLSACALSVAQPGPPQGSLHLESEIVLTGVEGRIDHLAADVAGKRVFIAAHDNGTLEIVDLAQGKRTAEIKGLKEPQGVAYVPASGVVYVAGGGDGTVRSFDSHTLKPLHDVTLGSDADNLRYDAAHQQLLAGYGSGAIAVLGLDLSKRANFSLPAHPESFQLAADGQHVYVNLPDNRTIGSIDLTSQAVNAAWTHPSASGNFAMVLDATIHRLFIPCRKPARLQVVNADTGAITAWTMTVGDADDIFINEPLRLVYVIGGDGYVDVLYVRAADAMVSRQRTPTAPGARTGLYVPEWNKLLVAAPRQGTNEARLLVFAVEQ
jgi:DNA-binding beta-propeller fold protein YncE